MVSLLLQNRHIHVVTIKSVVRLGAKEISDLCQNFGVDGLGRSTQVMSETTDRSPPADFFNV